MLGGLNTDITLLICGILDTDSIIRLALVSRAVRDFAMSHPTIWRHIVLTGEPRTRRFDRLRTLVDRAHGTHLALEVVFDIHSALLLTEVLSLVAIQPTRPGTALIRSLCLRIPRLPFGDDQGSNSPMAQIMRVFYVDSWADFWLWMSAAHMLDGVDKLEVVSSHPEQHELYLELMGCLPPSAHARASGQNVSGYLAWPSASTPARLSCASYGVVPKESPYSPSN